MKRLVPATTKILIARQEFSYKGKIVVPETSKSKPTVGNVIAIGPEVTMWKEGDRVLFTRLSGIVFTVIDRSHPRANPDTGEVEFLIIDQTEVYGCIEEVEHAIEAYND